MRIIFLYLNQRIINVADYTVILLCMCPVCKLFVAVGVPAIAIRNVKSIFANYLEIQPCLYYVY